MRGLTDATRAGAGFVGCGAAEAIGRPATAGGAIVGCGTAEAIVTPAAAGATLFGCGTAEIIGRPAGAGATLGGCGAADAIESPAGGELTCVGVFGVSSLDVASVVFVLNPSALRQVVPSIKYTPIAAPNTAAKKRETSHQGLQGEGRKFMISGSSDRRRIVASISEEGRKPNLGVSLPALELTCCLA